MGIKYEVEDSDPRGEDPSQKLRAQILAGGKQGKEFVGVIPLFNNNLIVWKLPARESRG